jgi:Mrp family chromosome partitioning ATPase
MERIQAAIQKAKAQRMSAVASASAPAAPVPSAPAPTAPASSVPAAPAPSAPPPSAPPGPRIVAEAKTKTKARVPEAAPAVTPVPLVPVPAPEPEAPVPPWEALAPFEPSARRMARQRIVSFADTDPAHSAFDLLRGRILRTLRQNGWRALGITSPGPDCGKTTCALNLAFSFAREPGLRTVLVDLDLRRPGVARLLGLSAPPAMAAVLHGQRPVAESFVRYGDALAIGGNAAPVRNATEVLLDPATAGGVAALQEALEPDVILYDLPPVSAGDDVSAFLPHLDAVLVVAAAGQTRLDEIDRCEQALAEQTNVLGVVLNKCRYTEGRYGGY